MNFKPTIWKAIISLLVAIIIDYFIDPIFVICDRSSWTNPICPTRLQLMISAAGIIAALISFILVYIIWSLIQKKK